MGPVHLVHKAEPMVKLQVGATIQWAKPYGAHLVGLHGTSPLGLVYCRVLH